MSFINNEWLTKLESQTPIHILLIKLNKSSGWRIDHKIGKKIVIIDLFINKNLSWARMRCMEMVTWWILISDMRLYRDRDRQFHQEKCVHQSIEKKCCKTNLIEYIFDMEIMSSLFHRKSTNVCPTFVTTNNFWEFAMWTQTSMKHLIMLRAQIGAQTHIYQLQFIAIFQTVWSVNHHIRSIDRSINRFEYWKQTDT